MSVINASNLSSIVQKVRKLSGLTQKELADLAGVGKTLVFDIEKGRQSVSLEKLLKVLKVLNIKVTFQSPVVLGEEDA